MGIAYKQMVSMVFLLATLIITLMLGCLTFLINDNDTSLPDVGVSVGLEGNRIMGMDANMKNFVKHTKYAPAHSKKR
jgi:hypothetical protein